MDLITDVSACEYPRGSGGMRPFLLNKSATRKKERKMHANVPNTNAQFGVCLGFVEWRFESAELVNETAQRPDVRFGVVRLFLHHLR